MEKVAKYVGEFGAMVMRLGMIGMDSKGVQEGNRHPYSWAAICNGYVPAVMQTCGSPTIPYYLAAQDWPQARLAGVRVTHVWTPDRTLSEHIAAASLIETVVDAPEDMIGQVDGILLARDDAENHHVFARPFLEAGLPIFIDKPVALSLAQLEHLYAMQQFDGQIFTCSATRYAKEMTLTTDEMSRLGDIQLIEAVSVKDWDRYAIHVIEPVLKITGLNIFPEARAVSSFGDGGRILHVSLGNQCDVVFMTTGRNVAGDIELRVHGDKGRRVMRFRDTFNAFKAALADFIEGMKTRSVRSPRAFNERAVQILEMGRQP